MVVEHVAVKDVDFRHRGLGDQVENVGARAADADDADLAGLQLLVGRDDPRLGRGGVEVLEYGLALVGHDDRVRSGGNTRARVPSPAPKRC